MSYNVENLFDTINDPAKNDEDFLPEGKNNWTAQRYNKKLQHLSDVIAAPNEKNLPAVIGFYEVENKQVLENLAATAKLTNAKYKVVHFDSPDQRGIDVGMMYQPAKLKVLSAKPLTVELPVDPPYPTRDILMVKTLAAKTDTIFFFMNHWPSRRGGEEQSEPSRIKAASVLRSALDSIVSKTPTAKFIIMGDFNDYPVSKSVNETLAADSILQLNKTTGLFNMAYKSEVNNLGTYNYKDDWGMLDQFIVSYSLLNAKKGLSANPEALKILKENWMLFFKKESTESKPNATYGGPNYYGGYSDHLPIYMELTK